MSLLPASVMKAETGSSLPTSFSKRTISVDPFIRRLEQAVKISDMQREAIHSLAINRLDIAGHQDFVGQTSDAGFLVVSGLACRYATLPDGTRRIASFILPGDLVRSSAPLRSGMPWRIRALSACSVVEILHSDLHALCRSTAAVGLGLRRIVQDDLDRTRAWLLNDSRPAPKRIAYLLCELHARLDVVGFAGQNECELSLSQADVADAAAVSHNHANRILQALFSERFLSLCRQKLIITDVRRLREFACFDPFTAICENRRDEDEHLFESPR
ncbi:Crp/Fnr family transcriptional regulator [Methylobacterium oxalidis]|uniref:Crp/Fnr family transcriptional regulator n=1 Tax=Methylobacterium oxalidis TaxID=944322 RepID=UPI0011BE5D50|nr:hypothetical protein LDDCCGHA_6057 [Methylobacterium oxalidis]